MMHRHVATAMVAVLAMATTTVATAAAGLRSGAPAPAFELASSGGKPVGLESLRGRIVLLNFWASWCGPCRKEMPVLEQISHKYRPMGVALVGVNVEPDSAAANEWLKATPVSFPILYDVDGKVSTLYGVEGMPNTVIIDRKGIVRYVHRGYEPGAENEYLDQIRALIRE